MSDIQILTEIKRKNSDALEEAIHQYSGYVMAVIERTLGTSANEQDKEEILFDVFVALWNNAEKLREDSSLKAWLGVVARNASIKLTRYLFPHDELEDNLLTTDDDVVISPAERKEQALLVHEALDTLEDTDKDLFLRHYFWQQSLSEISKQTNMGISAIKSRLFRGRQKLKTVLIKEDCNL